MAAHSVPHLVGRLMLPWVRALGKPRLDAAGGLGHCSGMDIEDLRQRAVTGAEFAVRVTPRAGRDMVEVSEDGIKIRVTAPPEDGKANKAVRKLLAKTLGIAPTRLELIRGETARDKTFRLT